MPLHDRILGHFQASAQAKLNARKNLRDRMGGKALRLFSSSGLPELVDDTDFGSL